MKAVILEVSLGTSLSGEIRLIPKSVLVFMPSMHTLKDKSPFYEKDVDMLGFVFRQIKNFEENFSRIFDVIRFGVRKLTESEVM